MTHTLLMTLTDLQGQSWLTFKVSHLWQAFSKANFCTVVQHLTRFQLM